jgi:hypothetical protein
MSLRKLFTDHPASVGETYLQHLCAACWFATRMIFGGIAVLLHAFLPFAFRRTGSECITELHARMVTKRHVHSSPHTRTDTQRTNRAGVAAR